MPLAAVFEEPAAATAYQAHRPRALPARLRETLPAILELQYEYHQRGMRVRQRSVVDNPSELPERQIEVHGPRVPPAPAPGPKFVRLPGVGP